MIRNLFLSIIESSVSTSIVVLVLLLLSPILNKRYAIKWKYWLWIVLAFRLIIPFYRNMSYQQFVIPVPPQATTPIFPNTGAGIPIVLQEGYKQANISLLDLVIIAWIIGFLIYLSIHLLSYLHYKKKIIKNGIPIKNDCILRQLLSLLKDLKVKREISVIKYREAASPMIIGFFQPILILPENEYRAEELFFILKHELIHLKRHDVYFKLLFLVATALHWFNPIIYLMQKEAAVDMELSCDERVIQDTPYDVRKAYTETLLSTLHKQYGKKNILSTQFYGGTNIMKKRFKNILNRAKKKNGFLLLICTVSLTLTLGTLVGCSITKPDSSEPSPTTNKTENNSTSIPPETLPTDIQESGSVENGGETLSTDGQEIKDIVEAFATVYFGGDKDSIQNYLTTPFEWDIDVYEGVTDTVSDMSIKGLTEIGEKAIGDICVVSLEYKDSAQSDTFQYLTIELIKQSNGWKIQFYGIEG